LRGCSRGALKVGPDLYPTREAAEQACIEEIKRGLSWSQAETEGRERRRSDGGFATERGRRRNGRPANAIMINARRKKLSDDSERHFLRVLKFYRCDGLWSLIEINVVSEGFSQIADRHFPISQMGSRCTLRGLGS
jgi:hypothetical protein